MFSLTEQPIDAAALRLSLARPDAGALVVFEGWVRNHHKGLAVERLDYEACVEMTESEGAALVADVAREFPGVSLACFHRHGALVPGDLVVWIGAACAHRDDAFRACRLAIEEVKRRLPIWKREHHPGLAPVWVNCTEDTGVPQDAKAYYARQTALREVGAAGQARLAAANVLVVGLGGLGCPASLYLAGAGIGRLTLVDGGRVEFSNLHRQVLFEAGEVGASKATRAALALRARNPLISVEALATDLGPANVRALVAGRSAVLDCTDNFSTRLLLHDACLAAGVPLVQAAVHQWEGLVNVFAPGRGGCLYCTGLPPQPAELDSVGRCDGGAVFGPAVGMLGVWQAAETLKVLLGQSSDVKAATLLVDLATSSVTAIERPTRPGCPFCSKVATAPSGAIAEFIDSSPLWVDAAGFRALPRSVLTLALLAAGEAVPPGTPSADAVLDPTDPAELGRRAKAHAGPLVLTCPHGLRSTAVARALRAAGRRDVFAFTDAVLSPEIIAP